MAEANIEEIDFEELLQKSSDVKVDNQELNDDEPKLILENKKLSPSRIESIKSKPTTPVKQLRSDSNRKIRFDSEEKESDIKSTKESERESEKKESPKVEVKKKETRPRREEKKRIVEEPKVEPKKIENDDTEELTEQELLEEYKYKFKMLKKNYPDIEVPDKNSNLKDLKKAYDRAWKEVNDDMNVKSYYIYLIIGFFAVEYFCKHVVGIELNGFTINRVNNIRRYNHLLIELGERPYSSIGSSWPVEVRLCLFIAVDAVIFYILSRVAGGNTQLMETISGIISGFTKAGDGGGGGLGDIVGLIGQVMNGMGNTTLPTSKPEPKPESTTTPYEMKKPPKFVKKTT